MWSQPCPAPRKEMDMKQFYSIAQRNEMVENHLWCIDAVIRRNYLLLQAAHLDPDDVYQSLAIRLIRAVTRYDPKKGDLSQHIFCQLKYELLNCKSAKARYGFMGAPYDLRGAVISLESLAEDCPDWETTLAA